jgi:hypothetical protein
VVVGLVADAKYATLREPPPPTMYTAWAQAERVNSAARISLRVTGSADSFRGTVLRALQNVHPDVVVDFKASKKTSAPR